MSKKNFIAFVDLLGTSELSRVDPEGFYTSLTNFQETICNFSTNLDEGGQVYFFSDCAYIQSANIDLMVNYLRSVRQALSEQGFYMKGAISEGSLSASQPPTPRNSKKAAPIVKGSSFGPDLVRVYGLQDALRGIGIRIDRSVVEIFRKKGYAIVSCHLPQTNSRHAEYFNDLRFSKTELDENILRIFVRNFFKTNTKSRRFGRYYLSFLVSWINSTDFREIGKHGTGDQLDKMPLICQILLNGMLERNFTDLSGMEFIYFAILEKAYNECQSQKLVTTLQSFVAKRKKLIARLETVPTDLFNEKNRQRFLDFLSGRATGTL